MEGGKGLQVGALWSRGAGSEKPSTLHLPPSTQSLGAHVLGGGWKVEGGRFLFPLRLLIVYRRVAVRVPVIVGSAGSVGSPTQLAVITPFRKRPSKVNTPPELETRPEIFPLASTVTVPSMLGMTWGGNPGSLKTRVMMSFALLPCWSEIVKNPLTVSALPLSGPLKS